MTTNIANTIVLLTNRINDMESFCSTQLQENIQLKEHIANLELSFKGEMAKMTQEFVQVMETVTKSLNANEQTQKEWITWMKSELRNGRPKVRMGTTDSETDMYSISNDKSEGDQSKNVSPVHAFGKLPQDILAKNLPKSQLMRLSVVYEFIDTEQDYVRDLNVMLTVSFIGT